MKSTGIVRQMDELGRLVLPRELRKTLNLEPRASIEIFVEGDSIILKKYEPCCIFCGETTNITYFKDKNICEKCKNDLAK